MSTDQNPFKNEIEESTPSFQVQFFHSNKNISSVFFAIPQPPNFQKSIKDYFKIIQYIQIE